MKILILGDSWCADWSVKYPESVCWPSQLKQKHTVTNCAQAGVSQYQVCQQLKHTDPEQYDAVIFGVTSPNRLYSPSNPIHSTDPLHADCDLIYADLVHHRNSGNTDPRILSAIKFYQHHWDQQHAVFQHQLQVEWCLARLNPENTLVTSMITYSLNCVPPCWHTLDVADLKTQYPGDQHHLSEQGNQIALNSITDWLRSNIRCA